MSLAIALAAGGASLLASALSTGVLIKLLRRLAVMDRPNPRSSHQRPTVRGGGIAVVGVALLAWLALWLAAPAETYPERFWIPLVAALLLGAISWADDVRGGIPPLPRLLVQAACVAAGLFALPGDGLVFQGAAPALLDHALAALLWLWFVNLFNFMDGIDGIAATETATIGLGAFLLALIGALSPWFGPIGLVLAGVSLGFLRWNWHPAKIFLGDVGSVPLGYLLGWILLALAAEGAWAAALLLPAYYLADATITLARRLLRGARVWDAHREHFYQRAVAGGRSHVRVIAALVPLNMALIGLALASGLGGAATWATLAAGAVLVCGLLCYLRAADRTLSHAPSEKRP